MSNRRSSMGFAQPSSMLAALFVMGATGCGASLAAADAGSDARRPRDVVIHPGAISYVPGDNSRCNAVDVLFMIDNSSSMKTKQLKLASAFPGFIDAMFDKLAPGTDVHVGITTTSFDRPNVSSMEAFDSTCHTLATSDYIRMHFVPPSQSTGVNGEQGRLYRYQNRTYYATSTSDDRAGIKAWFTGAANEIGQDGSSIEFPSAALAHTADPANAEANQGFFRDTGAVLVMIALTDEVDKSFEGVTFYNQMIERVKHQCGGSDCVITAGLIPPCITWVNNPPDPLWQFLSSFGREPTWGDIDGTAEEYTETVGNTLATAINDLCNTVIPG